MINMIRTFLKRGLYLIVIMRLLLACILGGLIGYERESTNRPAGFRTHILVCVGSALVMITSQYILRVIKELLTLILPVSEPR